jgi:hypothetical protein
VNCDSCAEAYEIDGVIPDCGTETGCAIPDPSPENLRILEIYTRIRELDGLIDAGTVLKMYDATLEDLELLALIKREMGANAPKEKAD